MTPKVIAHALSIQCPNNQDEKKNPTNSCVEDKSPQTGLNHQLYIMLIHIQ
jgi:hypothetical protein